MNYPLLKEFLSRLGARLPAPAMHQCVGILNYLYVGWWMRRRGFSIPRRFGDREALYRALAPLQPEPLTYLEFGVWQGASLRTWTKLLPHPQTVFHGFDSFEGLPEDWRMAASRSAFDVGGKIPVFDDSRVRFFKGWFNQTLPGYLQEFPLRGPLIVHLDADLYSSTIYVLDQLSPSLVPGTILIFDEFFDREHELKALEEYLDRTSTRLECLGATRALTQVAFRVLTK